MRRALNLSAKQTAGLCVLGGFIAAVGFLIAIPGHATRLHHSHSAAATLYAFATLTTVVLGISLALFANSSLDNGIATGRWSDQEVESLRALLNSRPSNILSIALLTLMVAFLINGILSPHGYPLYWGFFLLSQTLLWLRSTTRRQTSNPTHEPTWFDIAPLQSDHWGR